MSEPNKQPPPDRIWVHPWQEMLYYSPTDQPNYIEYARVHAPASEPDSIAPQTCVLCGHKFDSFLIRPNSNVPYRCAVAVPICSDDYHGTRPCECHCVFFFAAHAGEGELRQNPRVNGLLVALRGIRDRATSLEAAKRRAEDAIEKYIESGSAAALTNQGDKKSG